VNKELQLHLLQLYRATYLRMFYSDTFPHIIQCLWLSRGKMLSGFAIGHPGQCRASLLVLYKQTCSQAQNVTNILSLFDKIRL
jgi:hypothetical protein